MIETGVAQKYHAGASRFLSKEVFLVFSSSFFALQRHYQQHQTQFNERVTVFSSVIEYLQSEWKSIENAFNLSITYDR